jgi:hypothetical protein
MAVYVDNAKNGFRGMIMCHMVADTLEELHTMADTLGLKRAWFQGDNVPHYDLSTSKRVEAIRNGAIPDTRKVVNIVRRYRTREEVHED